MAKSSKYKTLRQESQQEKELAEVQFEESSAALQLESDILATKQSLAEKTKNLRNLKGNFPLDAQAVIQAQIEVESLEDGLKRLNALKLELF